MCIQTWEWAGSKGAEERQREETAILLVVFIFIPMCNIQAALINGEKKTDRFINTWEASATDGISSTYKQK